MQMRVAGPEHAAQVNAALSRLSEVLGDTHAASDEDIARALSGPHPAARAALAETGVGETVGLALYSPTYSTVRGAAVYVSDLWVSDALRGQGLGRRLLGFVLRDGQALWDARWLKLNVYHGSPAARRFYDRLGFAEADHYTELQLTGRAAEALRGET
ncbi:GNAT family N-acetyltransferase [Aquicoccus sp. SCR17]|nr:GNAT family N-acetyltransferase [Carideicomes alvinocaridis]